MRKAALRAERLEARLLGCAVGGRKTRPRIQGWRGASLTLRLAVYGVVYGGPVQIRGVAGADLRASAVGPFVKASRFGIVLNLVVSGVVLGGVPLRVRGPFFTAFAACAVAWEGGGHGRHLSCEREVM